MVPYDRQRKEKVNLKMTNRRKNEDETPPEGQIENPDSETCTNVIISDKYALTAAHCVGDLSFGPE